VCPQHKKQSVPLEQSNGLTCFDNAVTESFFHSLKTELVSFARYHSREEAHRSLFEYIEIFYSRNRLHSSIGYVPPMEKLEQSITRAA
jgi:transposase InsO family protein